MNKMKKNSNEEKKLTLEEILKQSEERDKKDVTKKAIDKTKDITKNAGIAVKNQVKKSANNYKYKKENGIETADEKILSFIRASGIGPLATLNKWKLNRRFKHYDNEEFYERNHDDSLSIKLRLIALKTVIFLVIWTFVFRGNMPALLGMYLIYKYFQIQLKYRFNANFYEFKWYLKLLKKNKTLQKDVPTNIFYITPHNLYLMDNQLEDYLETRGSGLGTGKREKASIINSKLTYDEVYGWVREFQIGNEFFRKELDANALESIEINDYFLIPQANSGHNMSSGVYYQVHGVVRQAVEPLLELESRESFIEKVISDENINYAFPKIREILEEKAKMAALMEEKKREEEANKALENYIATKGLTKEVAGMLSKIQDKKDIWNFNVWNVLDNLTGNSSYFKVRCILRNSKSLNDIKKIQHLIESELRHTVVINERQDKRAFDLTVILKTQLNSFEMKAKELLEFNKNKLIYLGKSYTGDLVAEWNYQANHIVVAGKSGSGKSELIRELLLQFSRLDEDGTDFDYTTMFLTSSSKIGDFADFGKNGALVASGIDNQIKVFEFVKNMLEKREEIFYEANVQNIKDYNKKFPQKRMKQLILLADEYENTRGDLDKKKAQEAESLMVSILNIARSSGAIVIIGAQSILKMDIGTVKDKMTIKFSGKNETNVLNTVDPSIAAYYKSYRGKPQGTFFYQADNLEIQGDYITTGDTSFTLVQTPYISDISTKTLPQLHGAEYADEIFNQNNNEENSNSTTALDAYLESQKS